MLSFLRSRRRRKLRSRPVPLAWETIFRRLPLYRRLSPQDRRELAGHVHVFLDEKRFEGARGFVVTDEVALLIAAQACLLLLHRETDYYPRLRSIIVYPTTYVASRKERRGWVESEREDVLHGESWGQGVVVLSWAQASASAEYQNGGNLVLHEFAHQLDEEDGYANGAPILGPHIDPTLWARVMRGEYEALRVAVTLGMETILDAYGAESPAEFFSVATETFFERGEELRDRHPALYEQLKRYYQQDPAEWKEENL